MKGTVMNIFVTAAVLVSNVLNWGLAFIASMPEVEEKIFAEIANVMGPSVDRVIQLDDMEKYELFAHTTLSRYCAKR